MSEPTTVGDLDPDREVLRVRTGGVVHLPGADCRDVQHKAGRTLRAGVLFDDTPICRCCRGVVEYVGVAPGCHLPTTTEVPSDD